MGCSSMPVFKDNMYFNSDAIEEFNKMALKYHNNCRKKHNVPKLELSIKLCNKSQEILENLFTNINYTNDRDNEYGENIYISDDSNFDARKVENACKSWYQEKKKYNFESNKYQNETGHFTQMVWKETKKIGFGYTKTDQGKTYFLALYEPCGNELFCFKDNVLVEEEKEKEKEKENKELI